VRYGLPDPVVQAICRVLEGHPHVERAILYGSRAKGNCKHGSDIDLALCGGTQLTLQERNRILDELDDLLLPYTIDLSVLSEIHDRDVVEHIERAGVRFYARGEVPLDRVS
jgi:predicted nucleotidyltransferase